MLRFNVSAGVKKEEYTIEVAYDEVTNFPRWMIIRLNGKMHSPPDDRPAHVVFDDQGRPWHMSWHHEDLLHRLAGPSRVKINPENGVLYSEEFHKFGEAPISRTQPFSIKRNPETGEIIEKSFSTGKTARTWTPS